MLFQWNSSMLDAVLNLRITSHLKSSLDWSDRGLFKYVTCLVAIISIFYFHKIKTQVKGFFHSGLRKNMRNFSER